MCDAGNSATNNSTISIIGGVTAIGAMVVLVIVLLIVLLLIQVRRGK